MEVCQIFISHVFDYVYQNHIFIAGIDAVISKLYLFTHPRGREVRQTNRLQIQNCFQVLLFFKFPSVFAFAFHQRDNELATHHLW